MVSLLVEVDRNRLMARELENDICSSSINNVDLLKQCNFIGK